MSSYHYIHHSPQRKKGTSNLLKENSNGKKEKSEKESSQEGQKEKIAHV
jgi:hypothetical protein